MTKRTRDAVMIYPNKRVRTVGEGYIRDDLTRVALTAPQKAEVRRIVASKGDFKNATYTNDTTINYNGTVFPLLGNMTQGDALTNNYSGSSIQPRSVQIRGIMTAGDPVNTVRWILFQWKEDGVPTGASILGNIASTNAANSIWLWENRPFMQILADSGPVVLQNGAPATQTNGGNGFAVSFNIYRKSKLRKVFFSNTSGVVKKNGLYLLAISDSSVVPNAGITFTSQIIFTDGS